MMRPWLCLRLVEVKCSGKRQRVQDQEKGQAWKPVKLIPGDGRSHVQCDYHKCYRQRCIYAMAIAGATVCTCLPNRSNASAKFCVGSSAGPCLHCLCRLHVTLPKQMSRSSSWVARWACLECPHNSAISHAMHDFFERSRVTSRGQVTVQRPIADLLLEPNLMRK